MAKHVTEARLTEGDHLECEHCGDKLELVFHPDNEPPLWIQLAAKDAFLSLHAHCTIEDEQAEPTVETLRYERTD